MPIEEFRREIENIRSFDIDKEILDIITINSNFLAGLIRNQLRTGRYGNDAPVTLFGKDHYSKRTIFIKETFGVGLGKETGFITTYQSGNFYASIRAEADGVGNQIFKMTSDVPYFDKILLRSGEAIMELNDENGVLFRDNILLPELRRRFDQHFKNGI